MICLYGMGISPYVRKVLAVLALKDLPFKHIRQRPFASDHEYQKINPVGKIPTLRDDDLGVCDSKVICQYLEDAYPARPVYPTAAADLARARWLDEFSGSELNLASQVFFQRITRPALLRQKGDETAVADIIANRLPPLLDYVEEQVPAEGFLFGDIGVADISLVSQFINAAYAGYTPDAGRWPKFTRLIDGVRSHPVVCPLLADDARVLKQNPGD